MDNAILKANELREGNLIYRVCGDMVELVQYRIDMGYGLEWGCIFHPVPITEEKLIKFGFEKKELYGWKGNGADWQPETSKTEYQDFVLHIGDDNDFFIRYETSSYRKTEQDEWITDPVSVSIHYGHSWYEKANSSVGWPPCDYLHQLQNLVFALSGKDIT